MTDQAEKALQYVEEMFLKYDAAPVDDSLNEHLHNLGLRSCYVRNKIYYRAEYCEFDEGPAIVITATDNPSYVSVGMQDNIGGFPADLPKEKLEKEVRFLFGIEPFPDTYPDY